MHQSLFQKDSYVCANTSGSENGYRHRAPERARLLHKDLTVFAECCFRESRVAPRKELIIAPAVFEAKQRAWSRPMYMAMWLDTIEQKVTQIIMRDGWEYSIECVEEYFSATMMKAGLRSRTNIEIVDAGLQPILLDRG